MGCAVRRCTQRGPYRDGLCPIHRAARRVVKRRPRPRLPLVARFWAKVTVVGDDCWIWTGSKNRMGYGHLGSNGTWMLAHRFAYELLVGPIPEGLEIDHLCQIPACVNPNHLEPVTPAENMRRAAVARRFRKAQRKRIAAAKWGQAA